MLDKSKLIFKFSVNVYIYQKASNFMTKCDSKIFGRCLILWFCLIFLGCHKKNEQKIEIEFWTMGAEGQHIEKLLPEFEKSYPKIAVKVQSIPWRAAHEKLLTAFAGQSTPDVCQLGNTWIPEFQAIGALLPLDTLITKSSIVSPNKYFKGIWDTNIIGEATYGIPWYVDTRVLFYRSDIIKKAGFTHPPRTWDEWFEISKKIRMLSTEQNPRYAVFFSTIHDDWAVPVILIMQNNGILLKDNNCYAAFDHPATLEALKYYVSFFRNDLAVKKMTEVSNIYQAFADGIFSMLVTGPWNVNEFKKRTPEIQGKWDTATMPCKVNCTSIAGGSSLVIFKQSHQQEAAWKLIEFLSKKTTQMKFYQLTRDLPAKKAAWHFNQIKRDTLIDAFYQQLELAEPTPKIAEWEQVAVKIQEHLERAIFKDLPVEVIVKDMNRDIDRILEKRRWLLSKDLIKNLFQIQYQFNLDLD